MEKGPDHQNLINYFSKIEEVAEDILNVKQCIVDLSRKSNSSREAKRALERDMKSDSNEDKTWMCIGNMFIKVPKVKAQSMIQKDQKSVDDDINNLRDELKSKVENLRNLEGQSELTAYNLKPMSKDELHVIKQALSLH